MAVQRPTVAEIYNKLSSRYGNLNWWPARSAYEVMVGAVLTQNTNWSNVEKAIANFKEELSPEYIENISLDELKDIIRPAGFFNQKAVYLKEITRWYKQYNYSVAQVREKDLAFLRKEILQVRGVGRETADSILLYAFGLPTFVIDKYTCRLLERLGYIDLPNHYEGVKKIFEDGLPQDVALFNNYHACIVINAKEYCKAKPACVGCPLAEICLYRKSEVV